MTQIKLNKTALRTDQYDLHQLLSIEEIKRCIALINEELSTPSQHEKKEKWIPFNQNVLIRDLMGQNSEFATLKKIDLQFNGLCELICNYVMMNDLLGHNQLSTSEQYHQHQFQMVHHNDQIILKAKKQDEKPNLLLKKIGLMALNQNKVKNSHIIHVSSFFEKMVAYFFNIYPHSLFSFYEKPQIDNQVNAPLLLNKLNKLSDGGYVKFCVFRKEKLSFSGHSMVIKKTGDTYSFFDPNEGEHAHITAVELIAHINKAMHAYNGTDMAFLDGARYLKSLQPREESLKAPKPTM